MLWLIDDHLDIAQTRLAHRLRMDRATTVAIVIRMQVHGYLVRGASLTDRRKQTLNLTDRGRDALIKAKDAICEHERWLKLRFTEK